MTEESAREGDGDALPLLLTRADAAKLLSMSLSHFLRHVAPWLPIVRIGRLVYFARVDLEAWIDERRYESTGEPMPDRRAKPSRRAPAQPTPSARLLRLQAAMARANAGTPQPLTELESKPLAEKRRDRPEVPPHLRLKRPPLTR
jgi:hypothetical protein